MSAESIISRLRSRGFVLAASAKGIHVKPKDRLTADERQHIQAHRAEILLLLQAEQWGGLGIDLMDFETFDATLPADIVATDALGQPKPMQDWGRPRRYWVASDPLPALTPIELARMTFAAIYTRLLKSAERIGWLIGQGQGDSDEAQRLAGERAWIDKHRPDVAQRLNRPSFHPTKKGQA